MFYKWSGLFMDVIKPCSRFRNISKGKTLFTDAISKLILLYIMRKGDFQSLVYFRTSKNLTAVSCII